MKDELYVDIVSKTIISKLSEEISANISKQIIQALQGMSTEEIGELVSATIKRETDLLRKTISETEDSFRLHVNNSAKDINKHIDAGMEVHNSATTELKAMIKDELRGIREVVGKFDGQEDLKGIMDKQLTGFTGKMQTLIDALIKVNSLNEQRPDDELKSCLLKSFDGEKKIIIEQVRMIKEELSEMKNVLYSYMQLLESQAEQYSDRKIELDGKVTTFQRIWERFNASKK